MSVSLTALARIYVDADLFEYTHSVLREASAGAVEALALWAGHFISESEFEVVAVKIPRQKAIRTNFGLAVVVEGEELHRLNLWLHQERLHLVAQIHTHPQEAFHSDTDDAIPIVAKRGGLSLVIPDFAAGAADLASYAVYRLDDIGVWTFLEPNLVAKLVQIVYNRDAGEANGTRELLR